MKIKDKGMINFEERGTVLICRPERGVVSTNVPKMRDILIDRLDSDESWQEIVFDCSELRTLDSLGINLIVGLFKKTRGVKKGFRVTGCNEAIRKEFRMFRLDEHFSVE